MFRFNKFTGFAIAAFTLGISTADLYAADMDACYDDPIRCEECASDIQVLQTDCMVNQEENSCLFCMLFSVGLCSLDSNCAKKNLPVGACENWDDEDWKTWCNGGGVVNP